ncbi:HAD hydrolase family protein [Vibrio lentus]|nr:HAD hydrolase family protein [Vibrio lentus]
MLAKFHSESGFSYKRFEADKAPSDGIAKSSSRTQSKTMSIWSHLEQKLKDAFGDKLNIAFSTPWCLEVMAAEVSKGHALDAVAKSLNLTLENCVARRWCMNDAEMLAMAAKV